MLTLRGGKYMLRGRFTRSVYRWFHGVKPYRDTNYRNRGPVISKPRPVVSALMTLVVALGLALAIITSLEIKLRPMVAAIAQTEAVNALTKVVDGAILDDLSARGIDYSDFVSIHLDETGAITSLNTNMAAMNLLRVNLITKILEELNHVDISTIGVPIGSLIDSELLWAKGPEIKVRAMRIGTVLAEFESEFSAAGINQTMHRIYLDVYVPLTLILPGGSCETHLETRLCVAETIIVGSVPDAYLQMQGIGS